MIGCNDSGLISFSEALGSEATGSLRHRLADVLATLPGGPVSITTFFEIAANTCPLDSERRAATRYVIFDLQRLVLFHDSGIEGEPGIASLVHFLLDAYPHQPFWRYAAEEKRHPYRFGFDPAVLDILGYSLAGLAPGEYCLVDLLSGEVLPGKLLPHPKAVSTPVTTRCGPPPALALAEVTADRSLRIAEPSGLEDLVSSTAGVARLDELQADAASLPTAVSMTSWKNGERVDFCYGRAMLPGQARAVARAEAAERFQVVYPPPASELIRGCYAELARWAVNPAALFYGSGDSNPNIVPFDPAVPISWTWAWAPFAREWRLVPAQEVWFDPPLRPREPRFVVPTTSGCAAGSSFEEAALFGALEAIERDAFLTSWYLRRPAREIDLDSCESEALKLLVSRFRIAFPRYRVVLFDLTSDVGVPTVGGLIIRERGEGPRVYASAAAHPDPEKACFRALKDLTGFRPDLNAEQMAALRRRVFSPGAFGSPSTNIDLYALDESFSEFDSLRLGQQPAVAIHTLAANSPIPVQKTMRLDLMLERLDERLRQVGAALYIKDLTHPMFAARGLHTARAITPGLYPLWFGAKASRFAVTERLHRLALLYTGEPLCPDRLRLGPHPLG